jgi:tRNA (guanine-N7-)-methyltransferase
VSFEIPFSFEERRPYLGDQFLYVPEYFKEHDSSVLSWDTIAQGRKVILECCSGNGEWIVDKAQKYPHYLWIAVEKRFDRARKIWKKGKSLGNLFTVLGEGLTFATHYLPTNSIHRVFVNFPDPWPKAKHAKNRLLDLSFEEELLRVLRPFHFITVATDDAVYRNQIIDLFSKRWKAEFPAVHFSLLWDNYGSSYFNRLWLEKNKEIFFMNFQNRQDHA